MSTPKIVIIKKTTRLEALIQRYNTIGQVQFYLQTLGQDVREYQEEHDTYYQSLRQTEAAVQSHGPVQVVDRQHLPHFLFGQQDIVVVVGHSGLAVNTLKYLNQQPVIGINENPKRNEILMPFTADDLPALFPEVAHRRRPLKDISLAKADLSDHQTLYAVNDFFIGRRTHVSARYTINHDQRSEQHSSSGIIVSTGFGSTGWLQSILAGARGVVNNFLSEEEQVKIEKTLPWDSEQLIYSVREPFPSDRTGTDLVFGHIKPDSPLKVVSHMPEEGVIFSDGIESDYLPFRAGVEATIGIAQKKGKLVV